MISSVSESSLLERERKRVFLALFIALAIAVHTIEVLLPNPIPWFRIGLANIFGLCGLFLYGVQALWVITLCRIVGGSLLVGSLFAPGFVLSLGGGVLACSLMSGGYLLFRRSIGPLGVSLLGAFGHINGQLLIAWLLLIRHSSLWMLLPFFLLFALISGILNGIVSGFLLDILAKHRAFATMKEPYISARIWMLKNVAMNNNEHKEEES
jgi:heptaprenyl diphosphate synthase